MSKTPKLIQLYALLSPAERESLRKKLNESGRHRLLLLLEALPDIPARALSTTSKRGLYERLFTGPYTAKEDYLLRNEFRRLTEWIERLLIATAGGDTGSPPAYPFALLRLLLRRRAFGLFEKEFATANQRALERNDITAIHQLRALQLFDTRELLPLSEAEMTDLEAGYATGRIPVSARLLAALRQHQAGYRYWHDPFYPFSTQLVVTLPQLSVPVPDEPPDRDAYFWRKAAVFSLPPERRLPELQALLELAEQRLATRPELLLGEQQFGWLARARAHLSLGHSAEAETAFERFFAHHPTPEDPRTAVARADRIANWLDLGWFGRAAEVLATPSVPVGRLPRLQLRWRALDLASAALRSDTAGLAALLRLPNIPAEPGARYFFRFYHAILAHQEDRPDDAYRELENLRHATSKYRQVPGVHAVVNLFHRYFYTRSQHPVANETARHNLRHLAEDTAAFLATAPPPLRSYLPVYWLSRRLALPQPKSGPPEIETGGPLQ